MTTEIKSKASQPDFSITAFVKVHAGFHRRAAEKKKALLTSIKVAPLLKKGPLTYDNTMATELYEELQLSFGN